MKSKNKFRLTDEISFCEETKLFSLNLKADDGIVFTSFFKSHEEAVAELRSRLPAGIYYEPARGRYRVRLYKNQKEVFHKKVFSYNDAIRALLEGREIQKRAVIREKSTAPIGSTVVNLINSIKESLTSPVTFLEN